MVSFKERAFKVGVTVSVSISITDAVLFYWLFAVSHGNILLVLTFRPVRSPVSNCQYKKRRSYVTARMKLDLLLAMIQKLLRLPKPVSHFILKFSLR